MSDIEVFPGSQMAPEVLLHRVLSRMGGVKGVIVMEVDEHGAVEICWAGTTISEFALAAVKLQSYAQKIVNGEPPDERAEFFAPKGAA